MMPIPNERDVTPVKSRPWRYVVLLLCYTLLVAGTSFCKKVPPATPLDLKIGRAHV